MGMMISQTRVSDAGLDVKNKILTHLENWILEFQRRGRQGGLNLVCASHWLSPVFIFLAWLFWKPFQMRYWSGGLRWSSSSWRNAVQRCLWRLGNGSCHLNLQAVMSSEEPRSISLATMVSALFSCSPRVVTITFLDRGHFSEGLWNHWCSLPYVPRFMFQFHLLAWF